MANKTTFWNLSTFKIMLMPHRLLNTTNCLTDFGKTPYYFMEKCFLVFPPQCFISDLQFPGGNSVHAAQTGSSKNKGGAGQAGKGNVTSSLDRHNGRGESEEEVDGGS